MSALPADLSPVPHLTVVPSDAPEFSDESLALAFAEMHVDDLRYVATWGQWFQWDGTRWERDTTLKAYDLAREVCRKASARCNNNSNEAKSLASASTASAVEKLAKSDRRLAAKTDQWDRDPWLLNTPGGTVDLQTGTVREHRREDYCTKITTVAHGGACPRWRKFLDRVTDGDQALACFLGRMAGCALTGVTRDHAVFFLYGPGGNGKSRFIDAIVGAMGDYAATAPIETFMLAKYDRHPTELADLCGARLVTASEPEEGKHWNQSRLKLLTGGDRVKARFMREDFFQFTPQFKLLIMGNHRPSFHGVNAAIRRRMHLLPFNVKIPKGEIDIFLGEKLREEWSGILTWMIEGCAEWQRIGLAPPSAVLEATENYLSDEDTFGHWVAERTSPSRGAWTSVADLFESWSEYAEKAGEAPGDWKAFKEKMETYGFAAKRTNSGRGFSGAVLKAKEV